MISLVAVHHIAGNFGEGFNLSLSNWRICERMPIFKVVNIIIIAEFMFSVLISHVLLSAAMFLTY